MREHDKVIASSLLVLLLVAWFVFLVHEDPRFAGSAVGGFFGVLGLVIMLVAYIYPVVKRVVGVKRAVSRRMSLSTFLQVHVYAGILGPIFGLIHSGHKFESPTGVALTTAMLGVVFSGFVGRYFFGVISADVREKKAMLAALEQEYHHLSLEVAGSKGRGGLLARVSGAAEAIADVEYALETDERARRLFSRWLAVHVALSVALLALLGLHVFSSFYYGVRWLGN
jgi:hypothetical protein